MLTRIRRFLQTIDRRQPTRLTWIVVSVVALLGGLFWMVYLLPPPSSWPDKTVAERFALVGALVSFFGLIAAVVALLYAVEEVRQIFPGQDLKVISVMQADTTEREGMTAFVEVMNDASGSIVNALRIELTVHMPSDSAIKLSDFDGMYSQPAQPRPGRWEFQAPDIWVFQSESRLFPGASIVGPELHVPGEFEIDTIDQIRWSGQWWTDRRGPEPFTTGKAGIRTS